MIPISRLVLIAILTFTMTTGCGLFQDSRPHHNSCGPEALFYAFRWYGIDSSRYKISQEILDDNKAYSILRDVLSIFNSDLNEITFPQEMKDQLLKHNIKIQSVSLKEFKTLKKDKTTTAIILVHPKNELGKYHWLFYPTQSSSPSSFFGKTSVDRIYILER